MDGIGLENMLSAEQVEKMFGDTQETSEEVEVDTSNETSETKEKDNTAEVDFSDLLGIPEGVGSENDTEGDGGAPESDNGSGTPQQNLFSSIARILRDKGVFPDLSDDALENVKDEDALEQLFNDKVTGMLDERQRNLETALSGGATDEEMQAYQSALNISQQINDSRFLDIMTAEDEQGENFRKSVMYQDYINRGFKPERAEKLIQKSFEDGNDIDDAKEALESCKEYYNNQVALFKRTFEDRHKAAYEEEKKKGEAIKKQIMESDTFFGGLKVDKNTRQKAFEFISKPVYKDESGRVYTAAQKYQRENPVEFIKNMALMYVLTDKFSNIEKLTKGKVKAGLKKGFAELESVINSTSRNSDGTLNLANSSADFLEREKWTLA